MRFVFDELRHHPASAALCGICFLCAASAGYCADASTQAAQRLLLQRQQQQDALNFELKQGVNSTAVPKLDAPQQQRLQALQLRQRQERQQLEQTQLQQDLQLQQNLKSLPDSAARAQTQAEQQRFARERQMQLQRFDVEQQQLLHSLGK